LNFPGAGKTSVTISPKTAPRERKQGVGREKKKKGRSLAFSGGHVNVGGHHIGVKKRNVEGR